jgi:membrane protein required for colicin V production
MNQGWVLNPLDIIILAVIGFGMYRGAMQGIFNKATTVLAIGLAVILGFRMRYLAEIIFLDYLNLQLDGKVASILSFATAFVVVYVLVTTVLRYLTQGLDKIKLPFDRALGALAGGTVATLALSVVFLLLSYANFPSKANAQGSIFYSYVRSFSGSVLGLGVGALKQVSRQVNGLKLDGQPGDATPPPAAQQPSNRPQPIR